VWGRAAGRFKSRDNEKNQQPNNAEREREREREREKNLKRSWQLDDDERYLLVGCHIFQRNRPAKEECNGRWAKLTSAWHKTNQTKHNAPNQTDKSCVPPFNFLSRPEKSLYEHHHESWAVGAGNKLSNMEMHFIFIFYFYFFFLISLVPRLIFWNNRKLVRGKLKINIKSISFVVVVTESKNWLRHDTYRVDPSRAGRARG
jgi:hypothetical protein